MSYRFFFRLLAALLFIAASALSTGVSAQLSFSNDSLTTATSSSVVTTPRVRAELVAYAPEGVAPGKPLWLGLQITHQPGWHTYWKNPGDSGLPTELNWTLPEGVDVGDIAWPVPQKLRVEQMANYGYEGTVLLPVVVQLAPSFKTALMAGAGEHLTVRLKATWLACKLECIPEEGDFTLQLPLHGSTALHAGAFAASQAAQPLMLAGDSSARVDSAGGTSGQLHISVPGLPAALRGQTLQLFSEAPAAIEHAAESGSGWTQAWQGDVWTATLPLSAERGESLPHLPLVLTLAKPAVLSAGSAQAWRTVATVDGAWTPAMPAAAVSPALAAALEANRAAAPAAVNSAFDAKNNTSALLMALLGGLIGGLILNLMPCVFPVLAIKVMGFAKHASNRRAHRQAGLAYTAGVVLSFLALGGLLLALRAAGEQLGWGFQLQSPAVVAALAALFTLIGLNLAGVFEFGQFAPGRLAALQLRHPAADAFLTGVLAVAIASPCTAPFMGASLGFAVGMPSAQALAVFAALGVGMALPYLLASVVPAVAGWLPRPGAWMATFRHAMAFPMFATVVWLVWVLGQQSGIDGASALLALLVALAACAWSLTLRGRVRTVIATFLIATSAWLAWAIGPHIVQTTEMAAPTSTGTASAGAWQAWSAQRVADVTAAGQPVFVDFTAAWCVTCQYNKRTTLADAAVQADFAAHNVALLRADWTRRDPAITEALTRLGRSGVPVYVLYAPQRAPLVMTEILSPAQIHSALAAL